MEDDWVKKLDLAPNTIIESWQREYCCKEMFEKFPYNKMPNILHYEDRFKPDMILKDFLYLGSMDILQNNDGLEIKNILSITGNKKTATLAQNWTLKSGGIFLWIKIGDVEYANIKHYFKKTNQFLQKIERLGERVFVHCSAGISRSPTIVIAYLLFSKRFTILKDAFMFVKEKRNIISPNLGFMRQLKEYEEFFLKSNR